MSLANVATINTYSVILLAIIYFNSLKNADRDSMQSRLFIMLLKVTAFLLVFDVLGRFDGNPGTFYSVFNYVGNLIVFMFNMVLPSLWLMYVYINIFHDESKVKRLIPPLVALNAVNVVMVVLTQFFGWFYYIDANNIYHRGPLFTVPFIFVLIIMVISFLIVIINRKKVNRMHYYPLLIFAIPPFASIVLQSLFYGTSLMLNTVATCLLVVYLNIQSRSINADYLTGVNNRKRLDNYLKEKIAGSTECRSFSAIMIDLNNFKTINDTYGHDEGDRVLKSFADMLRNCLRSDDFIARYGGDEFWIVLDTSDKADLDKIVHKIKEYSVKYNKSGELPYKIEFSMGYSIYDVRSGMGVKEFQKQIDQHLYENKPHKKLR